MVRDFIGALWDQSPHRIRGEQQNVPAVWWDNPQSRLMLYVGWCPGLLAREGWHVVGFLASGWLACARRGHMNVGWDAHTAATAGRQSLPDVWQVWYFSHRLPHWPRRLRWCSGWRLRRSSGSRRWPGSFSIERPWPLSRTTVWLTCWTDVSPRSPWDTPPLLCIGSFTFMSCVLLSCLHHALFFFSCLHFCACDAVTNQ